MKAESTPACRWLFPLLILFAVAGPASARDGAFEISPLCVATGCFAGDDPGLPVEITQPGRYVLTGNLEVASESDEAIRIASHNVHLDLNGFSLIGPVDCSGATVICDLQGPGVGIRGAFFLEGIRIENGGITGFGDDAIRINGAPFTVQGVKIFNNAGDAIDALSGGTFINNNITFNGGDGISSSSFYAYSLDNRIINNGGVGIGSGACGNNLLGLNDAGDETCNSVLSTNICGGAPCP